MIADPFAEVRRLDADLRAEKTRVGAAVRKALVASAAAVQGAMRAAAPVETGALRASIDTRIYGDGRSPRMTAVIRAGEDYAAYVEYGTAHAAPQPYAGPAAAAEADRFTESVGKASENL